MAASDASGPIGDMLRAAPCAGLAGSCAVPGDKSISHRALILGAMAAGETRISGLLEGEDVLRTAAAVRAFGAELERDGPGAWRVRGATWRSPAAPIDCGNSGTAARLLMGAAAGFPIEASFTGDASLSARPMERVLNPLRAMGARVASREGRLPVVVSGGALGGIRFVSEPASAQVKSAILLAGLRAAGAVEVLEPRATRDHTERMLRDFGCDVAQAGDLVRLGANRRLSGTTVIVPGDPSSAAFPLVAGLLVPGSAVTVTGVLANKLRTGLFETLREMGADLRIEAEGARGGEAVVRITAAAGPLRGVEVPAARAPAMIDEYPILAVAAAAARGRTVMRGLAELRVKESDRMAAILAGLRACGVDAQADGDALIVEGCDGPPPGGGAVAARGDHRIAMSFLVMGLAARAPVTVDSGRMIDTSFPGFADLMRRLGGEIG